MIDPEPLRQLHLPDAAAHSAGAFATYGAAIGRNPVSWLVPCHRVILANGYLHNYEWGLARKAALIGWEAARSEERRSAAA